MAWKPRLAKREPNVDPFNAPDPVMPGGEPELEPARERPDADDGIGRIARRNERKEPGHYRHRPKRTAKTAPESTSEERPDRPFSPIQEENLPEEHAARAESREKALKRPTRIERERTRHAGTVAATPERRGKKLGCVVALVIFIAASGVFGELFSSCSGCMDSLFSDSSYEDDYTADDYSSDYAYDYDAYDTAQEELLLATEQRTVDELEKLVAGEGPYAEIAAQGFSETFELYTDFTPQELGIDAEALVRKALAESTYSIESTYAFGDFTSDGLSFECSSYFNLYLPDFYYLGDEVGSFAADLRPDAQSAADYTSEDVQAIIDRFDQMLSSAERSEAYCSMEFEGTADEDGTVTEEPVLLEESWLDDFASRVGAYGYLGY